MCFEDKHYISTELLDQMNPKGQILKTYITTIDLSSPGLVTPDNHLASVKVNFFKNDDWWKSGWLIEGFILEPVYPNEELKE